MSSPLFYFTVVFLWVPVAALSLLLVAVMQLSWDLSHFLVALRLTWRLCCGYHAQLFFAFPYQAATQGFTLRSHQTLAKGSSHLVDEGSKTVLSKHLLTIAFS